MERRGKGNTGLCNVGGGTCCSGLVSVQVRGRDFVKRSRWGVRLCSTNCHAIINISKAGWNPRWLMNDDRMVSRTKVDEKRRLPCVIHPSSFHNHHMHYHSSPLSLYHFHLLGQRRYPPNWALSVT